MGSLVEKGHQQSSPDFKPVPEGIYTLEVSLAELVGTAANPKIKTLKLEATIAKGKQKGQKVWYYFNFNSDNQTAVNMSVDAADNLMKSIYGKPMEATTVDHFIKLIKGKTFKANLSTEPATATYKAKTVIQWPKDFVHDVSDDSVPDAEGGKKKKKKKKKGKKSDRPW